MLTAHSLANAQQGTIVKGQVNDNDGFPIFGVSIIAKNLTSNFTAGAQTDSLGIFRFSNLPSGGPYFFYGY